MSTTRRLKFELVLLAIILLVFAVIMAAVISFQHMSAMHSVAATAIEYAL
jgi:hypothetical protein